MNKQPPIDYKTLARREYVQIFADMRDAIKGLDRATQGECYFAVVEFGFTGKIPEDLSPISKAIIGTMKQRLLSSLQHSIAAIKREDKNRDKSPGNVSDIPQSPDAKQTV